jgi:hypothetical protein
MNCNEFVLNGMLGPKHIVCVDGFVSSDSDPIVRRFVGYPIGGVKTAVRRLLPHYHLVRLDILQAGGWRKWRGES